ncbi:MAG: hypothetical protein QF704_16050, partial [Anaerolineales bacterium]|nr:hypothetical protein [Anaerolineales bacterium]
SGTCTDPHNAWNYSSTFRSHLTSVGLSKIESEFTADVNTLGTKCGKIDTDANGNTAFTLSVAAVNVFRSHTAKALLDSVFTQCTFRQIKYVINAEYHVDTVFTIPEHEDVQVGVSSKLEWVAQSNGKFKLKVPVAVYTRCKGTETNCYQSLHLDTYGSRLIDVQETNDYWKDQAFTDAQEQAPVELKVDNVVKYYRKSTFSFYSEEIELPGTTSGECKLPDQVVNFKIPMCDQSGSDPNPCADKNPAGTFHEIGVSFDISFDECPKDIVQMVEGEFNLEGELGLYAMSVTVPSWTFAIGLQREVLVDTTSFSTRSHMTLYHNDTVPDGDSSLDIGADDWVYIYAAVPTGT